MRLFGVLLLGMFTGFAVSYTGPAFDLGFAVNAAASATGGVQSVDRTHKGDRLDRLGTRVGKRPVPVVEKLLVGCEPATSPLTHAHAAVPGRCST